LEDWVKAVRRKKWNWAGNLARRIDGRWSTRFLEWAPSGHRSRGHSTKSWCDDMDNFLQRYNGPPKGYWTFLAQKRVEWKCLGDIYLTGGEAAGGD